MNKKIITILESVVREEQWSNLQKTYGELSKEKTEIWPIESFLLQDTKEPSHWKIVSIWQDMETLQKMRDSGEIPAGVRIFHGVHSEPTLTVLEVSEEI